MAATPEWKVYRDGQYVAACKHAEDAAVLVAASGGVVKHGHSVVVWQEGKEEFGAGDSYDRAAYVMERRRYAHFAEAYKKAHGKLPD